MDGKTFVREVESILAKNGIAKEDFYEQSGIPSASFSQYRTGLYSPSKRTIQKAIMVLGESASFLLDDSYTNEKRPRGIAEAIGQNKQALLDAIEDMTEAEMVLALEYINKIKNIRK